MVLQLCRLVRGFTHPASYFADDGEPSSCMNDRNHGGGGRTRDTAGEDGESREDLALFSVDEFSAEMVRNLSLWCRVAATGFPTSGYGESSIISLTAVQQCRDGADHTSLVMSFCAVSYHRK